MNAAYRIVSLTSPDEWRLALHGIPHAFAHTWEHCSAAAFSTEHEPFLFVVDTDCGRAVCTLAIRPIGEFADVVTPYGFGGFVGAAGPEVAQAWSAYVQQRGFVCAYLMQPAVIAPALRFGADEFAAGTAFVFDLRKGLDRLATRLHANRIRELRRTEADAPRHITTDKACVLRFLLDHYAEFASRKGASATYRFTPATLRRWIESSNVSVYGWLAEDQVVGAIVCGRSRTHADYLLNVSVAGGAGHTTPLVWRALHDLIDDGIETFNLGGGIRPGDGVAQFKARFGTDAVPLRCVKQIFRPDIYDSLCGAPGASASSAGYFPRYRAPIDAFLDPQPAWRGQR